MAKKVSSASQKTEKHPAIDIWELTEQEVRALFSKHLGLTEGELRLKISPNGGIVLIHEHPWKEDPSSSN